MLTTRSIVGHAVAALLLVAGSAQAQCFMFAAPTPYPLPVAITATTTRADAKDVDGDGDVDMLVISDALRVFRNNGSAVFTPQVVLASTGQVYWDGKLGDINGDNRADIVVSIYQSGLGVMLNQGGGVFGPMTVQAMTNLYSVYLGDVDGDGDLDLTGALGNDAGVCINDGSGNFAPPVLYPVGEAVGDATLVDLNADGRPDIACAVRAEPAVRVLLNNGDGTFGESEGTMSNGDSTSRYILAIDVDGDADLDLAVTHLSEISVAINNGKGGFTQGPVSNSSLLSDFMATGDFDGDGNADIAVVANIITHRAGLVSVRRGNGNGTFSSSGISFNTGPVSNLLAADFNGDGGVDLGVSYYDYWVPHSTSQIVIMNGGGGVRQITNQPDDAVACEGGDIAFSVTATSGRTATYQWYRDGLALSDGATKGGSVVSGATTTDLAISGLSVADVGTYTFVQSTECGSLESEPATLTLSKVCCRTDVNHDGTVNSTDVSDFINIWFEDQVNGTLLADFNGDLTSNSTDVSDFINTWFDESAGNCR